MLRLMKPRSVVMDLSIDMGGCFETSRPTSFPNPTYEVDGILHFCVPNLPSTAARSATQALTNAVLPYLTSVAELGPRGGARARCPTCGAGSTSSAGRVREGLARVRSLGPPERLGHGLGRDLQEPRHHGRRGREVHPLGRHVWIHAGCNNPEELVRAMVGAGGRASGRRGHAPPDLRLRRLHGPALRALLPPPRPLHGRQRARRPSTRGAPTTCPSSCRRSRASSSSGCQHGGRGPHPRLASRRARLLLLRRGGRVHEGRGRAGDARWSPW